jgi:hypothetical protein
MKIIGTVSLLLVLLLGVSSIPSHEFGSELGSAVKPYRFSVVSWEFKTIIQQIGEHIWGRDKKIEDGIDTVSKYLALGSHIQALKAEIGATDSEEIQSELNDLENQRDALGGTVEIIIKQQVQQTLAEQGIYNPWNRYDRLKVGFPPVNLKLETPPHLLVISRRDRIETIKTILLDEDLSLEEMTAIEAEVDKINVSSLVVDLGGLGTYPSLVESDASLQFILETAAHEWTHEYLAFTPLGFRYLLDIAGLSHNPDIVTMNETVADTVGKEIGAIVIQKYYPNAETSTPPSAGKPAFDFDQEMRDTRKTVDQYLSQGEIDTTEKFMQEKRDYFETKGYYIRKLNQAYFAFNGQYADNPAFISPIGTELSELRAKSASLSDFLNTVASMTSQQDLDVALGQAS